MFDEEREYEDRFHGMSWFQVCAQQAVQSGQYCCQSSYAGGDCGCNGWTDDTEYLDNYDETLGPDWLNKNLVIEDIGDDDIPF